MGRSSRSTFGIAVVVAAAMVVGVTVVRPAVAAASPATYYVAVSGSDSAAGSLAKPWRTVKKGLTALRAGDTLQVRGGTYLERIINPSISPGTASKRITVKAYPGERPVIQGLLWVTGADYVTFAGINVTWDPATGGNTEQMVKFTNGVGWTFKDAEVWGAHSYADFLVASTVKSEPAGWVISGNCIHDAHATNGQNQDQLLYVNSHDTPGGSIRRNVFFNASNGEAIKLGSSTSSEQGPANVAVRYNTIYHTNQSILVAWGAKNNSVVFNLLDFANADGKNPGYGNIRGYQLTGGGNEAQHNLGHQAHSLILNDAGYPGIRDMGDEMFPRDPKFDSTSSCGGFHPGDGTAQQYGRYA